jgi:hypothetical protein
LLYWTTTYIRDFDRSIERLAVCLDGNRDRRYTFIDPHI